MCTIYDSRNSIGLLAVRINIVVSDIYNSRNSIGLLAKAKNRAGVDIYDIRNSIGLLAPFLKLLPTLRSTIVEIPLAY